MERWRIYPREWQTGTPRQAHNEAFR